MASDTQTIFDKLMATQSLAAISTAHGINRIGLLVDVSGDLRREDGNARALAWCEELAMRKLLARQAMLLEYFRANAWHNRQKARQGNAESVWEWEQPELQQQVFHLRGAVRHAGFARLSHFRRCQILTNLGNQLNTVGRFVDAGPLWDRALADNPRFGMALGNRGYGRIQYAQSLYDTGHRGVFLYFAHKDLRDALSSRAVFESDGYPEAKAAFGRLKQEVEVAIDLKRAERLIDMDGHPLGRSKQERHYRSWALRQRLFLNPLNDLGPHAIAAQDVLSLPTLTTSIGEFPPYFGFFNQMKQEFASGRWLLYDGLHAGSVHFSDRGVALINTLDYPSYSLGVEKVKAAYRLGYSILDKIAFFLNDYAALGVNPRDVYFRTVWYVNPRTQLRVIRKQFTSSQNWPLRGLYWLSKDLFDPQLQGVMEPDAQELYSIRNRLEHSYLKVHDIVIKGSGTDSLSRIFGDRLAYSVSREALEAKTLQVFRLARSALIYLALGVHRVEQRRSQGKSGGILAPMLLDSWSDRWKR